MSNVTHFIGPLIKRTKKVRNKENESEHFKKNFFLIQLTSADCYKRNWFLYKKESQVYLLRKIISTFHINFGEINYTSWIDSDFSQVAHSTKENKRVNKILEIPQASYFSEKSNLDVNRIDEKVISYPKFYETTFYCRTKFKLIDSMQSDWIQHCSLPWYSVV